MIRVPAGAGRSIRSAAGSEAKNMKGIDVIIILGGGINERGRISQDTRERLDGFLKKKKELPNAPVLLSGRWGGFAKKVPNITEAQAMKDYLVANGFNAKKIYLEMKSLDTISNAVFLKQIIEKHRSWKTMLLITSDWHMDRALWIFRRILGEGCQVIPLAMTTEKSVQEQHKEYDRYLLAIAKRFLHDIPASSKELIKLLKTGHPFYSKSKKAKKLLQDVVVHRRKIVV